jgi:hypothetical protein
MAGTGQSQRDAMVNSLNRAWIIAGRARPDHTPDYQSYTRLGPITWNIGSVNPIFDPDPQKLGSFIQTGSFRDAEERPTTSLISHYAADIKSALIDLATKKCPADIQLHIGKCEDPSIFENYVKAIIFEDVQLETYSTEDLGALEPGEQGKVDETGEISAARFYEFRPLSVSARTPSAVTNRVIDVVICDNQSCGDCEDESDGCQRIIAITNAAGGSPSTPADIVYSLDKGLTWLAHDIDSLDAAEDPSEVDCVGRYVVVVSNASGSLHYAPLAELKAGVDPDFTEVSTGFVVNGEPNAIHSVGRKAYIVGDLGYIYTTTDPTAGVTPIDEGSATVAVLNAVYGLSEEFAVAVGNDGAIIVINNDLASSLTTTPIAIGEDIISVFVKNRKEWFIGTASGNFWYTLDGGETWTQKVLDGSPTAVTAIDMPTASVMYVSATVSTGGTVYLSINGGQSFERLPSDTGIFPPNDEIDAIAVCAFDPDFFVAVGLGDDATDGFIAIGND